MTASALPRVLCAACRQHVRLASAPRVAFAQPRQLRWLTDDASKRVGTATDAEQVRASDQQQQEPLASARPAQSSARQQETPVEQLLAHWRSFVRAVDERTRERRRLLEQQIKDLDLQGRFHDLGGQINDVTGYKDIERLRANVVEQETTLKEKRDVAQEAKVAYTNAVALRSASQREVNDLLQRKATWSGADVLRFTELVREDHANEQAEQSTKREMEVADEDVEKTFSALMQAILERYHEEQMWSDKIRSLSTYGSLGITCLNVVLFIFTILLVEPWKRRRLVEGVESRLRDLNSATAESASQTLASIHQLVQEAQTKLVELNASVQAPALVPPPAPAPVVVKAVGEDEAPSSEELAMLERLSEVLAASQQHAQVAEQQREKELWLVGAAGAAAGLTFSLLAALCS